MNKDINNGEDDSDSTVEMTEESDESDDDDHHDEEGAKSNSKKDDDSSSEEHNNDNEDIVHYGFGKLSFAKLDVEADGENPTKCWPCVLFDSMADLKSKGFDLIDFLGHGLEAKARLDSERQTWRTNEYRTSRTDALTSSAEGPSTNTSIAYLLGNADSVPGTTRLIFRPTIFGRFWGSFEDMMAKYGESAPFHFAVRDAFKLASPQSHAIMAQQATAPGPQPSSGLDRFMDRAVFIYIKAGHDNQEIPWPAIIIDKTYMEIEERLVSKGCLQNECERGALSRQYIACIDNVHPPRCAFLFGDSPMGRCKIIGLAENEPTVRYQQCVEFLHMHVSYPGFFDALRQLIEVLSPLPAGCNSDRGIALKTPERKKPNHKKTKDAAKKGARKAKAGAKLGAKKKPRAKPSLVDATNLPRAKSKKNGRPSLIDLTGDTPIKDEKKSWAKKAQESKVKTWIESIPASSDVLRTLERFGYRFGQNMFCYPGVNPHSSSAVKGQHYFDTEEAFRAHLCYNGIVVDRVSKQSSKEEDLDALKDWVCYHRVAARVQDTNNLSSFEPLGVREDRVLLSSMGFKWNGQSWKTSNGKETVDDLDFRNRLAREGLGSSINNNSSQISDHDLTRLEIFISNPKHRTKFPIFKAKL